MNATVGAQARQPVTRPLEVIALPYASGAKIRNCDVRLLDDETFKPIRNALHENLVLLFRDQSLTDPELMTFGRRFGKLLAALPAEHRPAGIADRDQLMPEINIVSNVKNESGMAIGVLGDGEADWHSDYSFYDIPLSISLLHAWEVTATGGETGFANMYVAYDTLPAHLRQRIQGLRIKHDLSKTSVGQQRKGIPPTTDVRTSPGAVHPIVRTHPETGYNALYLGRRRFAYIMGLSVEESEDLLNQLWAHATRPELQWHHTWKKGDIIVWDNACLLHHRYAFDPNARRIMHRVQCEGSKPFFSPASNGSPHPRAMSPPQQSF
jgi:taurine dioxygenase